MGERGQGGGQHSHGPGMPPEGVTLEPAEWRSREAGATSTEALS